MFTNAIFPTSKFETAPPLPIISIYSFTTCLKLKRIIPSKYSLMNNVLLLRNFSPGGSVNFKDYYSMSNHRKKYSTHGTSHIFKDDMQLSQCFTLVKLANATKERQLCIAACTKLG